MKPVRTSVLSMVLAVAVFGPASAQPPDPALGTWKLNVAKSKFNPGPAPRSATVTFVAAGRSVKVSTSAVAASGNKTATEYTANYDGRDYPITGSPLADYVSLKRIDARTILRTDRKDGKTVQTLRRVVSADGKTMIITSTGTNARGERFNNVAIYEKQ